MAITIYEPRVEYVGAGNLADYTFDFKIASLEHLLVIVTDDTFVETFRVRGSDTTDLDSVEFDPIDGGGTVHLAVNLPTNHHLFILLANDGPLQESEFKNKTDFTLKRFEDALDVLGGAIQRLTYLVSRSFRIPEAKLDADAFDIELPAPIEASKVIAINSTGDGIELIDPPVDGAAGAAGADGRTILSGSGAPSSGLGSNGDFYIDTAATALYGPKTAGAWGSATSLIGPTGSTGAAGADGNSVLNGTGAPGGGTGVDGDFYIDTAADSIYGPKAGGVWGSGTSLIGPTGATGAAGADGLITALDTAIGATPTAAGMSESGGTLTLQPANGTHGGVVSNTTQSFLGVKTFINNLLASADVIISGFLKRSNTATITAFAGGGQASATALSTDYNRVTTVASAADSVKLPTGVAGQKIVVVNDGANDCDVFPFSGEAIDALGTDAAYSLTAGTNITFICIATGVWKTAGGAAGSVSPLTTKGDLWGFSTVDARLPVGTNRQVLEADSTQTLGVGWVSRNQIFGSTGTPRSVVAATGIVSGSSHMSTTAMVQTIFVEGSISGESDVSANPQVENGTVVGQIMHIIGANDANYIKLETGNGLRLNGEWFSYSGAVLSLLWNGTVWTEIGRVA